MKRDRILGLVVSCVVGTALVTGLVVPATFARGTHAQLPADALARDEADLAAAINVQRSTSGLAPVATDYTLTDVARKYSQDEVARGFFSHRTPDGKSVFDLLNASGFS